MKLPSPLCAMLMAFFLCLSCVHAIIPKSYGTVSQDDLAAASVSSEKLQPSIVGKEHLKDFSVTNQKLASFSISDRNLQNNAVTSRSLAVDFVHIHIPINFDPTSYDISTPIGPVSIVPAHFSADNYPNGDPYYINHAFENLQPGTIFDNFINPSPNQRYVATTRAAGTGVILGWYPVQNGHLLRYQADRALKFLKCSPYTSSSDTNYYFSSCESSLGNLGNAENGVPVYSTSLERVEIDSFGVVRVYFFGAGLHDAVTYYYNYENTGNPKREISHYYDSKELDIDITVAVLLDNQIGQ